jgi:hypothetical protein
MGNKLFDKFTYLHFASGITTYYWNISFTWMLILHTIFEILENTSTGIHIIDNYITFWPGGKVRADSLINSIGDTIGVIIGWVSAYYISN